MRVLMVHTRYRVRGGEDISFENEVALLRGAGCIVDEYADSNERLGRVASALRATWSREAHREVAERLARTRYDIVHVQNFFPLLSPAVHYAAQAAGVATVQSLRNYRLICPRATLFRDGHACEECVGRLVPWPALAHSCYRDSRAGSAAVVAAQTVHGALRTWHRKVDLFIAISRFVKDKLVEGGLPPDRLAVKTNFVPDTGAGAGTGGYALFVGRLSEEKGVRTLVDAWRRPGLPRLLVVGEGPLQDLVKRADNVEWLGPRTHAETLDLMGDAGFLVCPSEWPEPQGRVVLEAFSKGTPVLAADVGGLSEMVLPDITGQIFRAGDADDLHRQTTRMSSAMRAAARREYRMKYGPEGNLAQLLRLYERAASQGGATIAAAEAKAPAS